MTFGRSVLAAVIALVGAPLTLLAQSPEACGDGTLEPGDFVLERDESGVRWADTVLIELSRGQRFSVSLESDAFDAFLRVVPPERPNEPLENDDFEGLNSRISSMATVEGEWKVYLTSLGAGSGDYHCTIELGPVGRSDDPQKVILEGRTLKGRAYASMGLTVGFREEVSISLTSDLDPYNLSVVAHGPSGQFVDSVDPLALSFVADEEGTWVVYVMATSFGDQSINWANSPVTVNVVRFEELGSVDRRVVAETAAVLGGEDSRREPSGEFVWTYEVDVQEASDITFELESTDFDPFLVVETAQGLERRVENDDADDASGLGLGSQISFLAGDLEESDLGTWQVYVTSVAPSAEGEFTLRVIRGGGGRRR